MFMGGVMLFLAFSKSLSVGTDTYNYYLNFLNIKSYLFERTYSGTQKLWYYYNIVLKEFSNYDLFIFSCYFIIIFCFFYSFYKKSSNPVFSVLIFVLMYFYFSSFNIMRQYIALSIISVSYVFLTAKKYLIFLILIVLALGFHFSAIISLFAIVIMKINNLKSICIYTVVIVSFILGFYQNEIIKNLITSVSLDKNYDVMGYQNYFDYFGTNRNILANIINNIVFVICYYLHKDRNDFYLKMFFVSTILDNLFGSAGHASRFLLYFYISILFVFPEVLKHTRTKMLSWAYLFFIIIYMSFVFYSRIINNESNVYPYTMRSIF